MKTENLLRVSTYAKRIGKSVECVRVWIRTGRFREGKECVTIDGVTFINTEEVTMNGK